MDLFFFLQGFLCSLVRKLPENAEKIAQNPVASLAVMIVLVPKLVLGDKIGQKHRKSCILDPFSATVIFGEFKGLWCLKQTPFVGENRGRKRERERERKKKKEKRKRQEERERERERQEERERERARQKERERERETDRQTDRQTERQIDRERERERLSLQRQSPLNNPVRKSVLVVDEAIQCNWVIAQRMSWRGQQAKTARTHLLKSFDSSYYPPFRYAYLPKGPGRIEKTMTL